MTTQTFATRFTARFLALALVGSFWLVACQPTGPTSGVNASSDNFALFIDGQLSNSAVNATVFDRDIKAFCYAMLRDIYLWNDRVQISVDTSKYSSPEALVQDLVAKPDDRFTAIVKDGAAFLRQLSDNQQTVFGFQASLLNDTTIMVAKVIPNAPAGLAGMKRGMRLLRVNGTPVTRTNYAALTQPNDLVVDVRLASGKDTTLGRMTRATVNAKTVLHHSVITTANGKKVAYLVYDTFLGEAKPELDPVFAFFKAQGATELVLDMRYNGGGSVSNAQYLGSLLAPSQTGKVLTRFAYNSRYQKNNQEVLLTQIASAMPLERLFVIMAGGTASASELIINGMMPYMPVITIGSTSYGKNVGSNVLTHPKSGYVVLPITFAFENARGDRDFGTGFKPTRPETDDVTRDFGDRQEKCLAAALAFIEQGKFPTTARSASVQPEPVLLGESGAPRVMPLIVMPK